MRRSLALPHLLPEATRTLQALRRQVALETGAMLLAGLALAAIDLPPAGGARALWAALAAGWVVGASLWYARYLAALSAPCPRCRRAFFVSWERLLWSMPLVHRRCAHCSLSLHARR